VVHSHRPDVTTGVHLQWNGSEDVGARQGKWKLIQGLVVANKCPPSPVSKSQVLDKDGRVYTTTYSHNSSLRLCSMQLVMQLVMQNSHILPAFAAFRSHNLAAAQNIMCHRSKANKLMVHGPIQ